MSNEFQSRSPRTLLIESMLEEGIRSIGEIARTHRVTRQRVQQIKRRLFTTSLTQPPQGTQTALCPLVIEGHVLRRTKIPVWAKSDKELMLRCVDGMQMRRFKIAQFYWRERMSVSDIAQTLGITPDAVKKTIQRMRDKT